MSGKFMRIEKIIIPTLTAIMIASQLTGCAAASQSELLTMLQNGEQIEIEVAMPAFAQQEQGTEPTIEWIELASLSTNEILRSGWDDQLGIVRTDKGKNGLLYVNAEGANENNNTLSVVMHNREFQKLLESEDSMKQLSDYVVEQYVDVEEEIEKAEINKQVYIGINGYFNLLPNNEVNYANGNSVITRAEALAMVFRADTPVTELSSSTTLTEAVGENPLNIYAQGAVGDSYLDLTSKSLNNLTYNGSITRAEYIYMLMHRYFQSELSATTPTSTATNATTQTFTDAKDGGDIASKQKFDTSLSNWKSYELTYAIQNPEGGLPTELYKGLITAKELGLIENETRWDETITQSEAIELLCKALQLDDSIPTFSYKLGEVTGYEASSQESGTGAEAPTGGVDSENQTNVSIDDMLEQYENEHPDADSNSYEAYEDEEVKAELTPEQYTEYLKLMREYDDEQLKELLTPEQYAEYMEDAKELSVNKAKDPHYYDYLYEDTSPDANTDLTTGTSPTGGMGYEGNEFDPNIDLSDSLPCVVN